MMRLLPSVIAALAAGSGARTIRFELHGSYCGGHGTRSCIKQHRITTRPFQFKMPE